MLRTSTVFVLGAGASHPFGFPLGRNLISEIVNMEQREKLLTAECAGCDVSDVVRFQAALQRSAQPSIDSFLEHRTEQEQQRIGRCAIALKIIQGENEGNIQSFGQANWYRYLFSRMNSPLGEFGGNRIQFVTFNYDRSLEYFLHSALMHSHDIPSEAAAAHLRPIRIIHVHGQIGYLQWQNSSPAKSRGYTRELTRESVFVAAEGIRIIADDHPEIRTAYGDAQDAIRSAERVFFLGFGYHEFNMKRLGFERASDSTVFGMRNGFSQEECAALEKKYPRLSMRQCLCSVRCECDIESFLRGSKAFLADL